MKAYGLILAGAAVLLAGCNGGSSDTGQATTTTTTGTSSTETKPKTLRIAMIAKSNDNPVFQVAKTGAMKAAEELSKSTGTAITIDWLTPDTDDAQEQAKRIGAAVAAGTGAILISCSDAPTVTGAINDAVDKGVPVMTFDSDAPDSKRFAFYGTDDADCGAQVMDELAKLGTGPMNVAILGGRQTAPNLQKRVKAVQDEAKKYPNVKIVTVGYFNESPADATNKVLEIMHANPEVNAWAMIGGWPLFAKALLTDLDPTKVKVVAVDALPAELAYVDKGIAPVLLAQPIYQWGYKSVSMLVDKVINKKDIPVINKMELVRVTKDNLGTWAKQLQDWGLKDVDPKYLAMASKP